MPGHMDGVLPGHIDGGNMDEVLAGHMDGVLPGHMDGVLPRHMDGVLGPGIWMGFVWAFEWGSARAPGLSVTIKVISKKKGYECETISFNICRTVLHMNHIFMVSKRLSLRSQNGRLIRL